MKRNIFIGGAWPYANGSLHIGHMAALVPGDVLARYHRANGDNVIYVSGSDCHGTPISIRASKEGVPAKDIALRYHNEFEECFEKLNFTYDKYTNTMTTEHEAFVINFFEKLINNGSLYQRTINQVFCEKCNKFLPDRYVSGKCPVCGEKARGDQCDSCGTLLEPERLLELECAVCGNAPTVKPSTQLYLNIIRHKNELIEFVRKNTNWRQNAINESKKYLEDGLQDRAATRDIDWGIEVPYKGYEDKRIYVWFEAVLGYLSAAKVVCEERNINFYEFWNSSFHYYVHGKDNIPFHSIILPALLMSYGHLHLPDMIISSEYMTLEGKKISTSNNWAIWMPYLLERYDSDSIRMFFLANGPELKDADFTWNSFITFHNSQIVGAYGNLVNRTLAFINKYFDGCVPQAKIENGVLQEIKIAFDFVGQKIEMGNFREAISKIFSLVDYGNKYYDIKQPWITRTENLEVCYETMYNCVQIIANLSALLEPFMPCSSGKVKSWLKISDKWEVKNVSAGLVLPEISLLFERIDKKRIAEELENLKIVL